MKSENCQPWTKYAHIQSSRTVSITLGSSVVLQFFWKYFPISSLDPSVINQYKGGKSKSCVNPTHDLFVFCKLFEYLCILMLSVFLTHTSILCNHCVSDSVTSLNPPVDPIYCIHTYPETNMVSHPRFFLFLGHDMQHVGPNFYLILEPRFSS